MDISVVEVVTSQIVVEVLDPQTLALATVEAGPNVVVEIVTPGPQGPSGSAPTFTVGAVPVSAFQTLMFDALGRVVPGDPSASGYIFAGLAKASGAPDAQVEITDLGLMTNPAWSWAPGAALYAAAGGALTQAVPTSGPIFQIAKAVTATTIFVEPYESVMASIIDGGNF